MSKPKFKLFEAFGIELEYMIVDRVSLRPLPIAEKVLVNESGQVVDEITIGSIGICNELAAHVIEFKTERPVLNFHKLEADFLDAIHAVNERLAVHGAMLAPGGIHPFMDPTRESAIWPHGNREIYEAYDRIFDCKGHGWFNLQSCHLNLPFSGDEEFAVLHDAIILLLPFLPALSAASPYIEGKSIGYLDTRISVYIENQKRIPQICGNVVPERVGSKAEYEKTILKATYDAISPLDPEKLLQFEWLNSRGAIARFDRNAIEIRILDTQESPIMDLSICTFIIATLKQLVSLGAEKLESLAKLHTTAQRKQQLLMVAKYGGKASVELKDISQAFELDHNPIDVDDLWNHILRKLESSQPIEYGFDTIHWLLRNGTLAERMKQKLGVSPDINELKQTVSDLSNCLDKGQCYKASELEIAQK